MYAYMKFVFFSVSENGENGLSDEGAYGAMPPPGIFGLEPPPAQAVNSPTREA